MHLGIDGGQSQIRARSSRSSEVVILDGLSRLEGDTLVSLVFRVSEAAVSLNQGGEPISRMVLGLSTLPDSRRSRADLLEALAEAIPAAEIWLTGDAVTGHAGALPRRHGVSLIVGTGVACIGVDAITCAYAKVNGDGFLIGDAGGAFWIGRKGLAAVIRAADGRGESTTLTDAAHHRFGDQEDLAAYVHSRDRAVNEIAQFAADVQARSSSGDDVATAIIGSAADELLCTIRAAGQVVDTEPIPVAMSGRAVAAGSPLYQALTQRIALDETIDLRASAGTPLDGALQLATDGNLHPYADLMTLWRRPR